MPNLPEDLQQKIQACPSLPSLPAAALQLLDMWSDKEVTPTQVAGVIRNDPALAAAFIKTANSPFYGFRSKVGTLDRAIAILGLNATFALALGFSLIRNSREDADGNFDILRYWRRSALAAAAARAVGKHLREPLVEELFLGGLLQDIGMLVLSQALPQEYGRLSVAAGNDHVRQVELEWQAFGASHAEVGSKLVTEWGFPENLCLAVQYSHNPEAMPVDDAKRRFSRSVALGGLIADCLITDEPEADVMRAVSAAQSLLEMSPDEFEAVMAGTSEALAEVSSLLEIDLGSPEQIDGALLRSRDALVALNLKATREIRRTEKRVDELTEQASRDSLTGVFNRRHLEHTLQEYFAFVTKTGVCLSVLFCDVDRFKKINDIYGHQTGDVALQGVASILAESIRTTDLLGRYGGEEFVVILPGASAAEARIVAERIRCAFEERPVGKSRVGTDLQVTMSVGAATYSRELPFRSWEDLLHAADTMLYRAKQSGRNRTVMFDDPESG